MSLKPGWERDAMKGYKLMRAGEDYVNNSRRYDKAHKLLTRAYEAALKADAQPLDLARISLWLGITTQENTSYDKGEGVIFARNKTAMELYKRALKHARYVQDVDIIPIKMSLYNSLGVACQGGLHDSSHHSKPLCTPAETMRYYQKARDIYRNHLDLQEKMSKIMQKVTENSGGTVLRGGGGGGGGGNYA